MRSVLFLILHTSSHNDEDQTIIFNSDLTLIGHGKIQVIRISKWACPVPSLNVRRLSAQNDLSTTLELHEGLDRICLSHFLPDESTKLKTRQR